MKLNQLIICLVLLTVLIWLNQAYGAADNTVYGGLSWIGWTSLFVIAFGIALVVILNDSTRAFGFFSRKDAAAAAKAPVRTLTVEELTELNVEKYRGPEFPHPVIFTERCIGCQACVDACPHDVLAIVDGRAAVVGADQCMEDTACEAECPVNPKACIVINTTKNVRSRPAPVRDGANFQTNVDGCYIIGDVSGVPLIKNAVKEGAEVIEHIMAELKSAAPEPKAEYDVAIIGIGPGGASAAITAKENGLSYVGIEQEKILSTIEMYPKGKYIFFKPDTKDWQGGLKALGLGLAKAKYGSADGDGSEDPFETELKGELDALLNEQTALLKAELLPKTPQALHGELSEALAEKTGSEFKKELRKYLQTKGTGNWKQLFEQHFVSNKDEVAAGIRSEISNRLETKIPGDQRERILDLWLSDLKEKGVSINEEESCKEIKPAADGDYFTVETNRGSEKTPHTYKARRVVLAIGLRGAPNRLRLPNEDSKFNIRGAGEEKKVLYALANPLDYRNRHIIIVGGGNSAVEAAVDLVARRDGGQIIPRSPDEMNTVTLLVRSYFAPTVKFGNKFQLYQCFDDGLLDVRYGIAVKELRASEVVLEDVGTGREIGTIPNDYIFALIGGERPDRFLKSIGIEIV